MATLPHFYDSHEDFLNGVKGLSPNEENHSIFFDIEPVNYYYYYNYYYHYRHVFFIFFSLVLKMTGTPLYAKKRIQFSFPLGKINKIDITKNLPDTLLPFLWVEESIELPDYLIDKLNSELFRILQFLDVIKWVITLFGAGVVSGGVGLYYKEKNSLPITPTSSATSKKIDNPTDKTTTHELGHTNFGYIN